MKKQNWIVILSTLSVSCCLAAGLAACKGGKTSVVDDTVQYTYRNPDAVLPDYDTDVITVDGKIDESVYNSLRWWEAAYPEDDGVNVRATSYAGAKGIFFIFDVDDYAVNVNPLRASWENSGVTIYVAKSDVVTLNDDVWEIELCPDNSINAKSYMGGYYYTTIQPDGFENKPFVRTVTKGGPINTDDCRGYVMESYFTYEYLFGSEEKPENGYKINYSLQRNSNTDKNHNRDSYYNFGENLLGAYNWNVPSTWWSFNDNGIDSVLIASSVTGSGKIEIADKFVSRYGTTSANIIPDDGHRIKCVKFGDEDVTGELKYKDGVNTLKLRNLAEDCSISAEFEAVPAERSTVSGNITFKGSALTAQQAEELQVRVNIGGIVYISDIDNSGSYTLNAANGKGTLEVVSKLGYSVKRESIEVSGNATKDIALTAADYGNNRVISLDDEAVITSKVNIFDASEYMETMNGTFTYAFNLKYNGKLLDESGATVDPTEGRYDHQYTSANLYMSLKSGDNASENLHLQLLRWDSQWILKASVGDKNKSSAVDNELLSELGSENGVNMLMVFADNGVSFYKTNGRGGVTQKILEIDFVNDWGMTSAERKLSTIEFYCENVVGHNIWAVENNVISLGKTIDDYEVYEYYYNAKATLTESANTLKDALGLEWDINHGDITGGLVDSFKVKASGVNADGAVSKDEQILFNMLGCDEWSNRLNATLYLKKDGGSYFGMNLGPVTNTYDRYVLSDAQLKALGGDGLNVYLVQSTDNTTYSLYVADGNNLVHVRDITSDGKGKAYGYELTYDGTNTVNAETSAFKGETTDKLLQRINSYTGTEYSQITEGTITEVVELVNNTVLSEIYTEAHSGSGKGTVISTGKWDRGNSVWHFTAEVSNFFKNGAVSRDLAMKFNHFGTNEWGLTYWQYNVYFKLDSANNKAQIEFQDGTNWTKQTYELTADELSALAASGRFDFYAIRNSKNKLALCIGNADGTVKVTPVVMNTAANFGVAELKIEAFTEGAAVAVTCHNFYVDYNFNVEKSEQELVSATCTNDAAPDKVRYIEHVAAVEPGHTTPGNTEYWVLDGKYYSDAEATVEISQDDTVIDPVGHSYDTANWEFDLTHHWHICPDDKAESEHAAHTPDGSGYCSVCGARPLGTLHKVDAKTPTCTEQGNKEYWTDGHYYFEDEAHTKPTTLSKVTTDALGHDYKYVSIDETSHKEQCSRCENVKEESQIAHSFTDGVCACGEKVQSKVKTFTGEKEETFGGYDDDGAAHTRFGPFNNGLARFTVKAPDAFDTDGNIKSAATMIMELKGCGEWYNHFGVKLNLKTSGSSISFVVNKEVNSGASDYVLTEYQLNALKTGGLEIFVETEGKKRFMYVKTSDSEIAWVNSFTAGSNDNQIRNFRIIYAQAAYGAEVSYDVVDRGWNNVRDVIENNFDSAYTIFWGEWNGESKAQKKDDGTYQKVEVKTGDIGAKSDNNFIHFNVKLDKQLATGECISLKYNGWSDKDFGVSTRLKFDGTKYVLSNCGLWNGSWVTFGSGVALTEAQSKKLVNDGLDFFYTQHGTDEFMSLYVYDGSSLTKLCDVCSKSNKPYSATASINAGDNDQTYTGASVATIKIDWYTYLPETTAEDAVKNYLGINA